MRSYTPIRCEHRGIRFEVTADAENAYWRIADGPFHRTAFIGQTHDELLTREAIREAREFIDAHYETKAELTDARLSTCHPEQVPKEPDRREAASEEDSIVWESLAS
jgi:hypothetical protein